VKRMHTLLIGVVLAAMTASTVATAFTLFTVQLHKTNLGKIIVNTASRTLYEFTRDGEKKDKCVHVSGCQAVWIPQPLSGTLTAGPGLKRKLLGTIKLGTEKQVTYAGHPLYIYGGDTMPAETIYVGAKQFGGHWYAINAKGKAVK
jgi:predicted lipoprotein with Yx(FWY)xxD motif